MDELLNILKNHPYTEEATVFSLMKQILPIEGQRLYSRYLNVIRKRRKAVARLRLLIEIKGRYQVTREIKDLIRHLYSIRFTGPENNRRYKRCIANFSRSLVILEADDAHYKLRVLDIELNNISDQLREQNRDLFVSFGEYCNLKLTLREGRLRGMSISQDFGEDGVMDNEGENRNVEDVLEIMDNGEENRNVGNVLEIVDITGPNSEFCDKKSVVNLTNIDLPSNLEYILSLGPNYNFKTNIGWNDRLEIVKGIELVIGSFDIWYIRSIF